MPDDFLKDWLEETPDVLYGAMRPWQLGAGRGYNFLDYFRGQQGNIYGDYLASLGRTALGGEAPTQTYGGYLEGFPWLQRYLGLSPEQRGEQPSRFAPTLRWMV